MKWRIAWEVDGNAGRGQYLFETPEKAMRIAGPYKQELRKRTVWIEPMSGERIEVVLIEGGE